jgi:autophagy-related protein 13
MGRKRYSSSFGHRYAASGGAGSDGSAGSSEKREGVGKGEERAGLGVGVVTERGSASFLSTNTDDDDISEFVQEIDSRKPLSGRGRRWERGEVEGEDDDTKDEEGRNEEVGKGDGRGAMLTSEEEVDEKLRQMNLAFLASLEGLGGSGKKTERRGHERVQPEDGDGDRHGTTSALETGTDRGHSQAIGRGRGRVLIGRRESGAEESGSGSDPAVGTGIGGGGGNASTDEIIGRMELDVDEEQRRT